MLKLSHRTLIIIAGLVWFTGGAILLPLGLHYLVDSAQQSMVLSSSALPLISFVASLTGGFEQAAVVIIGLSLFIGFVKGRYILSKSVNRIVKRIRSQPNPAPITKIYTPAYYLLIGSMVFIGFAIRFFGVSYDIRGMVDVAIGAALLNGSMLYFRMSTCDTSSP